MRRALLACAWLAAAPCAAAEGDSRRLPFTTPVTVAADGSADVGPLEGVEGALAEVVQGALRDLPFVPATRDGAPVASIVLLHGTAVLVPVGDEYEVAIEGLETEPRWLARRPADYPIAMARKQEGGTVALVLQVGADGRVRDSTVVRGGNRYFIAATREAVGDWRFEPPIEGHGFEVGAAFWFHGHGDGATFPDVPCNIQPQAAHLPGDDGCLQITETTVLKVRRGD